MRISLRECLYCVAIAALSLGWFIDRLQLKRQIGQLQLVLLDHDQSGIELLREIRTAIEAAGFEEVWAGEKLRLRRTAGDSANNKADRE